MVTKPIIICSIVTTCAIGISIYSVSTGRSVETDTNAQLEQKIEDLERKLNSIQSTEVGHTQPLVVEQAQTFPPDSPEFVVERYLNSQTWRDRLRFVKQTHGIKDKLARHYGDAPILFGHHQILPPKKETAKVVKVKVVQRKKNAYGGEMAWNYDYYLEKNKTGYSILWEPSVGWLPIGWDVFGASRPTAPTRLCLQCKLTNNYFSFSTAESVKHTHYELEVGPNTNANAKKLTAYVLKDSLAGKKIFEILRDGKSRPMVLDVHFRNKPKEECVWIRSVASDRAYTYDPNMSQHYVSAVSAPALPRQTKSTTPFQLSDLSARWTITRDVLGSQVLVVPEARFRLTGKSDSPITNLRVKVVYLELHGKGNVEILYEDTHWVVSSSDRPLEKGFSKVVLSKSAKGYRIAKNNLAASLAAVRRDAKAELYYDVGNGFVKLKTVPVEKTVVD